ncbi:MAG: hypothetical protein E6G67_01725 [Actinobacteria bacterium]|nr:MAG: hypothetical protein E6G67_01725 [Actinomycetota bacterium]
MTENHPEELELLAYADGELADPERVAAHVQACEQCGEQLRLLEDARTALREAPLLELPAERRAQILHDLPERPERRRLRMPVGALAAAAALLLIAGSVALFTMVGGNGGGGGGSASEAAGQAGGGAKAVDTGALRAPELGPLVGVASFLRSRGFDARVEAGQVVVRNARPEDVRRALLGRGHGSVRVVVR